MYLSLAISLLISTVWASVPIRPFGARIINGEAAEAGQFPWQVAIIGSSSEYPRFLCGGSLISDEWVLTAAHCVVGVTSANIYLGVLSIDDTNGTISEGVEFVPHEKYHPITLNNDIGLIKLKDPVVLTDNIQPIELAEEELEESNVTVSGWGSTSDDDVRPYSDTLYYITVTTIDNEQCAAVYGPVTVYPGLVCTDAGQPVHSACLGDSGAGVVDNSGEKPILVAVFSFVNSLGCEYPYPAGNTRTAYFRDWIRNQTGI